MRSLCAQRLRWGWQRRQKSQLHATSHADANPNPDPDANSNLQRIEHLRFRADGRIRGQRSFDFEHIFRFDFSEALTGSMSPTLFGNSLGTFSFIDTVYAAGKYSGRFNTNVAGVNMFSGTLTGSSGQELIGAWALPFHYSVDNIDHQAAGAWIGKR